MVVNPVEVKELGVVSDEGGGTGARAGVTIATGPCR